VTVIVSPVFQTTLYMAGEISVTVPPASVNVGSLMLSVVSTPLSLPAAGCNRTCT